MSEKSKLEHMLWEKGVTQKQLGEIMGVTSQRTIYNKLHKITDFTLSEMYAIQAELFPDYTLEDIFDGYGAA